MVVIFIIWVRSQGLHPTGLCLGNLWGLLVFQSEHNIICFTPNKTYNIYTQFNIKCYFLLYNVPKIERNFWIKILSNTYRYVSFVCNCVLFLTDLILRIQKKICFIQKLYETDSVSSAICVLFTTTVTYCCSSCLISSSSFFSELTTSFSSAARYLSLICSSSCRCRFSSALAMVCSFCLCLASSFSARPHCCL